MAERVFKTSSGRIVHFDKSGLAVVRYCVYCGSDRLKHQKFWPDNRCTECGLCFDMGDYVEATDTLYFNKNGKLTEIERKEG